MAVVKKPKTAEMHPGPGFRIRQRIVRPDPNDVVRLGRFDTPTVSDLMNRLYTMATEIRNLTHPELQILGPAVTVKCFPGDNLMVHKALDLVEPGDIIVVDSGGSPINAVLGDLISAKGGHLGVKGFVVDGLIRDLPGILELRMPVFARGVTPIGPLHRGPGEVNFPIQCGGQVVHPGDIVFGDQNGVVVVPLELAPEMLTRLEERQATEAAYVAAVRRGEFSNEWVRNTLEAGDCEVVDAED